MPLGFLARVLQKSGFRSFLPEAKRKEGVMFEHELPRSTSIVSSVPKGGATVVFPGTQLQTWIPLSGWDLYLRGSGVVDDLATSARPPQFAGSRTAPAARWRWRSG